MDVDPPIGNAGGATTYNGQVLETIFLSSLLLENFSYSMPTILAQAAPVVHHS